MEFLMPRAHLQVVKGEGGKTPALLETAASRVRNLKCGFGPLVTASVQAAFHLIPLEA